MTKGEMFDTLLVGPAGLPYRPCAGVLLLNGEGLIFAGQRIDQGGGEPGGAWQMPQGGIDQGESPRDAALRELGEETGIDRDLVEILAESPEWVTYDLPPELVGKIWKGRYGGQQQKWFAMRFLGDDAQIDIRTQEPEFLRWQWMRAGDLIGAIVPFKRAVYERVFADFRDHLA